MSPCWLAFDAFGSKKFSWLASELQCDDFLRD